MKSAVSGAAAFDEPLLSALRQWSAGDTEHVGGDLLAHLQGVARLLRDWGGSADLIHAGLFHSVYGTASFANALIDMDQRRVLQGLIGVHAEALVFLFARCDRDFVWPQFGSSAIVQWRDRVTGEQRPFTPAELREFGELTFANELEIAARDRNFRDAHGAGFRTLFIRMRTQVSPAAYRYFQQALGEREPVFAMAGRYWRSAIRSLRMRAGRWRQHMR